MSNEQYGLSLPYDLATTEGIKEAIIKKISEGPAADPHYKLLFDYLIDPKFKDHIDFIKTLIEKIACGLQNSKIQSYLTWLGNNYNNLPFHEVSPQQFVNKSVDLFIRDQSSVETIDLNAEKGGSYLRSLENKILFCYIKIKEQNCPNLFFSVAGKQVDVIYDNNKLNILLKRLKKEMLDEINIMAEDIENVDARYAKNSSNISWVNQFKTDLKNIGIDIAYRVDSEMEQNHLLNLELYADKERFYKILNAGIENHYELFLLEFMRAAKKYEKDLNKSQDNFNIYKEVWTIIKETIEYSTEKKLKKEKFEGHQRLAYRWIAEKINNYLKQNESAYRLKIYPKNYCKDKYISKIKRRIKLFDCKDSIKNNASEALENVKETKANQNLFHIIHK